jgi:hypothetical protein
MGISDPTADIDRIKAKLEGVFAGMKDDLKEAGEVAADLIVSNTLAGKGEDDQPFAPYSQAYLEEINAVGGKPQGTVNLRGVFYQDGQKRYPGKKDLGQGRRAYIGRAFTAKGNAVQFQARTKETRPQRGVVDKLSELSRDLIEVEVTDWQKMKIIYTPRSSPHMIAHQRGENGMPKRVWFTAKRQSVWTAMMDRLKQGFIERIQRFNAGG